jgi:hypothetical protein
MRSRVAESQAAGVSSIDPYVDQWAEIVVRVCNTELLTGHQNALIFGAQSSGRQSIMWRLVDMVNAGFEAEHHAAVYVELQQLVSASTVYTWTSVDAVYRALMTSPMTWAKNQLHLKPERDLQRLETQLNTLLDVPVAKLDMLAVRDVFHSWLDRLGVHRLSLFVDDVSALAPEFAPVLLQMLLDTFPRGSRVSIKLGAVKNALKLEERARRGQLGMQFSHDILVGLDLDQTLRLADTAATQSDPRQAFLLSCIEKFAPELLARVQPLAQAKSAEQPKPDPAWAELFEPAETWFDLYKDSNFDIAIAGAALQNLLLSLSMEGQVKADRARIEQVVNRAKAQAGLVKPDMGEALEPGERRTPDLHRDEVDTESDPGAR